eukprot:TRINITY_DN14289_c1_g5_i1.p1 TRINITY_DN14289_c1_g5~~TRINITY_DN14289_c1_g5_i1.p1  ORF type:complete len:142 (-),score=23.84 TRINITY_DN14289_c1_g5_i1:271-639(-)
MAEYHAAWVGGLAGCLGPLVAQGCGIVCGVSPEHAGSGKEVPRQPSGVIAGFGALTCSSAAAFATIAAGHFVVGAGVGVVGGLGMSYIAIGDMLKRRDMLEELAGLPSQHEEAASKSKKKGK